MSLTVKKASVRGPATWFISGGREIYRLLDNPVLCMEIVRGKKRFQMELSFKKGFTYDGVSRPAIAKNYILKFDPDNKLYNFAAAAHDWLYAVKGNGMFNRSECDDVLRGIFREAGLSRFKAGLMDWCVGVFAGGRKHWGNDSFGIRDLVECTAVVSM